MPLPSFLLLQTGTPLPFYPGGGVTLGAVLTMSRYPCSSDDDVLSGQCCRKQKCANYSGAHAVSRGCVLYGTLEAELAVHIPGGAEQARLSMHAGVACVLCGRALMCFLNPTRAALPNNPGNPAMFDWGTYVNGGRPDPSWRVAGVAR